MNSTFVATEWNAAPESVKRLRDGRFIVARNVVSVETEDGTVYRGESAVMTPEAYYSYAGANEAEIRRENVIIDEYTMELIEEGVI